MMTNTELLNDEGIDTISKLRPETFIAFSLSTEPLTTLKDKMLAFNFTFVSQMKIAGFNIIKVKGPASERA